MRLELKGNHPLVIVLAAVLLMAGLAGCTAETSVAMDGSAAPQPTGGQTPEPAAVEAVARPEGWSQGTHGSETQPNYDVVFPEDTVNQITITIAPEDWEAMQANMVDLFGAAGSGEGRAFSGGFERPEGGPPEPGADGWDEAGLPQGRGPDAPPEGWDQAGPPRGWDPDAPPPGPPPGGRPGGGGFGGGDMTPENPMWVPATIEFEGHTWTHVGVRYKGNSSLTSGWRSGTDKLPLKLDFDEFEDDHPEIEDQRFYGFKQLSLANGFSDPSFCAVRPRLPFWRRLACPRRKPRSTRVSSITARDRSPSAYTR